MRPSRGFTLLEVVLAMTLVSVIAAVGFAVLRTGIRSWDAGETRMQRLENRMAVMGFLRNYLANALPAQDDFSGQTPVFSFIGAPQAVRFVAFPPEYVGQGMRYGFDLGQVRDVLGVVLEPFGKRLLGGLTEPERIPLLDGVKQVRFTYFGRPPEGKLPEWREEWRFNALPQLVRVMVEAQDGTFESVVALRNGGKR
ncbi:MAG TPA: prepilin-type N-terminal cleavage/methylation domain-containing protein [Methylococcaceae bacterium]|nr:prepilin-type N-terminal cleavage/methylation domain-containing protein [Methylococcaceae bacterium]